MIALCLTSLLLIATAPTSVTTMTLAVVAPPDVTDSLVKRIGTEAQAIWAPAGIALEWERRAAGREDVRSTIEVTIDDRPTPIGREGALGWILFTNDDAARSIHLSRGSAEALLRGTPDIIDNTKTLHEALIGRALGRALANELWHYIFDSKTHTPRGLMRADWTSDDVFAVNRYGFDLTAQERAMVADHWWMDAACHRVPRDSSC